MSDETKEIQIELSNDKLELIELKIDDPIIHAIIEPVIEKVTETTTLLLVEQTKTEITNENLSSEVVSDVNQHQEIKLEELIDNSNPIQLDDSICAESSSTIELTRSCYFLNTNKKPTTIAKDANKIESFRRVLSNNSNNLKNKFENLIKLNSCSNTNSRLNITIPTNLSKSDPGLNETNFKESNLLTENTKSDNDIFIINNRNKTKHELAQGYGFNEDQIGIFEDTFQIFDKDCDGFITLIEIRTVMNSLGFFPGDDMIRKSIQDIDNDNSGTVDFEEFICMMSKFRKTTHELDEELKEIFKIFDKNQDGFIDYVELKDVLVRLGENITDDEVMEMIKEADLDGDRKVSYNEFRSILCDNKAKI